jgi:hypothetical protein
METPDNIFKKNPAFKNLTEEDKRRMRRQQEKSFNLQLDADRDRVRQAARHEAQMSADSLERVRLEIEHSRTLEKAAAHRLEGIRLEVASTPTIGQACLRAAAVTASIAGAFVAVSLIANVVLPSPKE